MTNTSSNSISSRRNPLNSATAAHLALMSNSPGPTYPMTNPMSNPPPAMLSGQTSAPYSRPTITTYLLNTSTSHASGSSARSAYNTSSSALSVNTSNKQSKLKTLKPKLPEYLADTSFAELYYNSNMERSNANILEKNPLENLALPTAWNVDDKCAHLNVDPDKLRVNYIGSGKYDTDAAAIRANYPMPPQCGLFYFEVDIISKGKDGFIGIGFCSKQVHLNRLPGWEPDSWGYHGDDGHSFCCSGTGRQYGPTFTTGDTVGCCLNFRDGTAFYTKNGKHLDLKGVVLYPSIGLRTQGESVEVNFGHRNFKYAIEHYMKEEKARLWHAIDTKPMSPISSPLTSAPVSQASSETNLTATVHQLILSYLVHHGYSETAKAFSTDAVQLTQNDSNEMEGVESENPFLDLDKDIINRQRIRDAVLNGDIDCAIKLTNEFYPSVLPSNDDIYFRLRCHEYTDAMEAMDVDDYIALQSDRESIEEVHGLVTSIKKKKISKRRRGVGSGLNGLGVIEAAMRFGQELQDDYRDDKREEIKKTLEETFSLLAYNDPRKSVVSYLLDPSGREPVANALNKKVYRQSSAVLNELARNGVGSSAF
ncbi:8409_t:CDS:10, partial [Funneliformis caledonium]